MIKTQDIHINYSNINMPILTTFVLVGSEFSFRITNAPKKIGQWHIEKVFARVSYPDNRIITKQAVMVAGCYVATFPSCSTSGKSLNGYYVYCNGTDENGNDFTNMSLGRGDFIVLDNDGTINDNGTVKYLHLLSAQSLSANDGDTFYDGETFQIYDNGWKKTGMTVSDLSSFATKEQLSSKVTFISGETKTPIDLQIEKLGFEEYYHKIDNGDSLLSNLLYVTSSDYTTGFFRRIIEVADPELHDDAANKRYVDSNVLSAKDFSLTHTDSMICSLTATYQPKGNYLTASTFIPTKTSDLQNDSGFINNSYCYSKLETDTKVNSASSYLDNKTNAMSAEFANQIDRISALDIVFLPKDYNDKVSLQDNAINILSSYGSQRILLPKQKAEKSRNVFAIISGYHVNLINDDKWMIENYVYDSNSSDPLTTSADNEGMYSYSFADIGNGKIKISRSKMSNGSYIAPYYGFKVTALQANSTTYIARIGSDAPLLQYMSSSSSEWNDYTLGDIIPLALVGDYVCFKNKTSYSLLLGKQARFGGNGRLAVSGNITSLLDKDFDDNTVQLPSYAFYLFFISNRSVVDASGLILPSTTLASLCYYQMFYDCTSLTQAPELPATTLAVQCYSSMFYNCTSLTQAPELPATTLAVQCYSYMFLNCISLTSAPELPATTLETGCYTGMFLGCTSLSSAQSELPARHLSSSSYQLMFLNCTSLADSPIIRSKTNDNYYYSNMFNGCSSLSSVTVYFKNWATQTNWLNGVAPNGVFKCPEQLPEERGVTRIPVGWERVNIPAELKFTAEEANSTISLNKNHSQSPTLNLEYSTDGLNWNTYTQGTILTLSNVGDYVMMRATSDGNDGTAVVIDGWPRCNRFMMTGKIGASGYVTSLLRKEEFEQISSYTGKGTFELLFYNCTSLTKAPILQAISLTEECYFNMFYGCTSLTEAPELPAITLSVNSYRSMFENCTSLSSAPSILPATIIYNNTYSYMFRNCTSLTQAPELLATTLGDYCCYHMFDGCTSLTQFPTLPATTLASGCYSSMFYNCTSLTQAPELPATTLRSDSYYLMFYGCTSLSSIKVHLTSWGSSQSNTYNWVFNTPHDGTFYCPSSLPNIRGLHYIPYYWTRLDLT